MKKIRLGYNCFIALYQVQTVCPVGLRILLQMTAPMKTSNTTARAAPAPHSRAIDEEEAGEGEQKTHYRPQKGECRTKKVNLKTAIFQRLCLLTCWSRFTRSEQRSWFCRKLRQQLLYQDVLLQQDWAQSGRPLPLHMWRKTCTSNNRRM